MVEWAHGYFSDGMRNTIYPLSWIVPMVCPCAARHDLVDFIRRNVRDLQCVLGLVDVYLLYDTLRTLGVRNNVAFIAALFFAITPPFA